MSADLHVLTGAYAGGALPADERTMFEEHLRTCSQCEQEVRELLETTALLGVAAAATPPPAMRARVMAEIAQTRQLPPQLSREAAAPAVSAVVVPIKRADRFRKWSLTAAACLAVFTIGLGAYATQVQRELSDVREQADQIAALQTSPDVRSTTKSTRGATATVMASRKANQLVLVSKGMAELRKGRTYQLWLIGKDGPTSAGTFEPSGGRHDPLIINGIGDADKLGITEEPDGGSPQPTTPVLMLVDLPQA
jgi:anti-sigma-K factor RskA